MSKKTQDMSKLRKKLEQSSRKTRRSTDLRRSLGRKSIGDVSSSDIATLEQASFSSTTLNESCHLNEDSAIINPAVAENPDWFKSLPPELQASEKSILEAHQKERDALLSNNSNISMLNASFDKRKIAELVNCSVVVSRDSIDRAVKRPSLHVDDSAAQSPPSEELSEELPKRRINTLGRGLRKRSGQSLNAEFKRAMEDSAHSDESLDVPRTSAKRITKEVSEKNNIATPSQTSNLETHHTEDISEELPQRRPNTLGKRLGKRSRKSLEAELRNVLEDSGQSDESMKVPRRGSKSSTKTVSEKNNMTDSKTQNPASPSADNLSIEIPKRRPNTFGKELKQRSRNSLDTELRNVLEDSGRTDESEEVSRKSSKSNKTEISEKNITTLHSKTPNIGSPSTEDLSVQIPKRRPNTFGKELKERSRNSLDAELRNVLGDSGPADESMDISRKHSKSNSNEILEKKNIVTHSKTPNPGSPPTKDSSIEFPKRKPNTLGRELREKSRNSLDAELRKALEDSRTTDADESSVVLRGTAKSRSKEMSNKTSHRTSETTTKDKSVDESLEIPRRKPTSIGKYLKRDCAEDSALDEYNKILGETSSSEDEEDVGIVESVHESLSRNPGDDKENVPQSKITILVDNCSDNENDSVNLSQNMPLGAEASNLNGSPAFIPIKKKSLTLGGKRVSKNCEFSVVAEVSELDPSQESKSAPRGNFDPPNMKSGNMKNIPQSSEDSVTDTTRHIPLSIANLEVIQPADLPVNLSTKSKNASQLSIQTAKSLSMLNISSPQVQSRKSQRESVVSEIVPINLSLSSAVPSPLTAAFSVHSSQAMNATPLSTQESLAPRRISKSFQEKPIDENLKSTTPKSGDSAGNPALSDETSSVSLPSDLTGLGSDSVFTKASSNVKRVSRLETETVSDSFPQRDTMGSDSVYSYTPSKRVRKSGSLQTESIPSSNSIPPTNVPEVGRNDTWTENPYPDRTIESFQDRSSVRESEPLEENSSHSANSDEGEEGYMNEGESLSESENPRMSMKHTQLSNASTGPVSSSSPPNFISPVVISQENKGRKSSTSGLNESNIGPVDGGVKPAVKPSLIRGPPKNLTESELDQMRSNIVPVDGGVKPAVKPSLIKGPPKKLTESELDQMRSGLRKWMDDIKKDVHTTVEDSRPMSKTTTSFKKPDKPAPKAAPKKKDPDPYFGDYRPPKRVKPRPYVTDKMYKFLEKKLKDKFGLESRIKAEEFVTDMCHLVQNTIKEKNKNKYLKMVFKLRDQMVKFGLIRTQFDFHLFIEDYLPDAFRVKSIPCYGCSKGPTLDVEDLHSDLSVK